MFVCLGSIERNTEHLESRLIEDRTQLMMRRDYDNGG